MRFPMVEAAPHGGFDDDESGGALNDRMEVGPFDLPNGAVRGGDVAYGADPLQRLDVYRPAAPSNAPVIMMVHGGGWARGDKRQWRVVKNKVTHWVGRGYIFVSTNYRMLPTTDPLEQADDIARALAFVQRTLESWGGDPSRLILMGHSSGAHLVALLTADFAIPARAGAAPWLASVSLDSAAMDVERIMRRRHYLLYDAAFRRDPRFWRAASPTQRLTCKPVAPMLIVCSTRRGDSYPQGRAFAEKAASFGAYADVMPVDLSHAEVNDFLGSESAYTDDVDAFFRTVGLA